MMSKISTSPCKVMHQVLHSFGDWELETRHMNRIEKSIYFDMRTLYLTTGEGLCADFELLARRLMCNDSNEQEALRFLLRDKFKLDKKTNQYKHSEWGMILKNYREPRQHNVNITVRNDCVTDSNGDVTETVTVRNGLSNAQRQQKLREEVKGMKAYLDSLGIDYDKKMPVPELRELFKSHGGVTENITVRNDCVTEQKNRNEENNGNFSGITITKTKTNVNQQQQQHAGADDNHADIAEPTHSQPAMIDSYGRHAMRLDWQPADEQAVNTVLRMAGMPSLEAGIIQEAVLEFSSYWFAKPDCQMTALEWDMKFARQSAKVFFEKNRQKFDLKTWERLPDQITPAVVPGSLNTTPAAKSKTAQSVEALMAIRAMVMNPESGFETVLPAGVCIAIVDGLLDLLGQGLKYPPAADAWAFTLKVWADEFAKRGLTDDDVDRVQAAFNGAKVVAHNSGEGKFPSVAEVIQCLPMKLMPRVEHKISIEEWAEKKETGKKNLSQIFEQIGKRKAMV